MKFARDYVRTSGVGDPETTDLDRRAQDGVRLNGVVKEVDYKRKPPVYRVAFGNEQDEDNYILTDWLPAGGGRAKGDVDTHFLEVGEKVTLLSEGGEFSTGHVVPAGTYTNKEDDEKAGTDKPGVWRKTFKTGAEISYDRETGALLFNATGKKKSEGQQDGASAQAEGDQEIKGTATIKAGGGTFVMKDDAITGTVGKGTMTLKGDTFTVKIGGVTLKVSGDGLEIDGGEVKHNGHSIGDDHKHRNVMTGAAISGPPV
ncbi:hypothetical protein [Methylobacterium sp. WCS2018Hpa-22]|uniref:hypothetical protein n=1 Tax=Methylobacterium sp. WCS2018Hpa-22 TaxID=3073633 RepID=UPI0028893DD4|nr:hypothetical protein [Methylobacterium sp. WCS2018Hpa-22]